jgi:hypothetical protein
LALVVHVVAPQVVVEPHATPLAQGVVVVGVTQVPAPSQVGAARSAAFAHAVVPQVVPDLAKAQPPLPLQEPSWPHAAVSTAHLPCDPPPALTVRHSPLAAPVSAIAHELQVAVHADSQQTPPTQLPSAHWVSAVQVAPLASFGVHAPARQ